MANAQGKLNVAAYGDRTWKRFLEGPDQALLEELYVPMLSSAVRYDRSCAYFSSSILAAAARGFAAFIRNLLEMRDAAPRPAVRLVVNEEMPAEDVRAPGARALYGRRNGPLQEVLRPQGTSTGCRG